MAKTKKMKFHVKAVVVKEKKKVLFAQVENKLVDVLLSFLKLPLATIVRLLVKYNETPNIGSLNSLYIALETMNKVQPKNPLELDIDKLHAAREKPKCIRNYFDTITCHCGFLMNKLKVAPMEDLYNQPAELHYCQPLSKGDCVSTNSLSSFILGDDLQILPNDPQSRSQILTQHQVEDKDMLEEMSFFWGFHQIMALLEGSLLSKTPLSNIIFRTPWQMRNDVSPVVKSKQNSVTGKASLRVNLHVYVQSSTKRVVFIESRSDFVEILFGFLAFSLRTTHRLCDGDCGLGSIVKDPKISETFIKKFIFVMEDSEVFITPASEFFYTLLRSGIPPSDIQVQELEIGVEEVSCLLKAVLHSKCAFTDGLLQFLK